MALTLILDLIISVVNYGFISQPDVQNDKTFIGATTLEIMFQVFIGGSQEEPVKLVELTKMYTPQQV